MSQRDLSFEGLTQSLLANFLRRNKDHAVICMDPGGTVVDWLGASGEIFGYTAEEAIGQNLSVIFTPEDQRQQLDSYELASAAATGRAEDDRWHVRKDGVRIWVTGTVNAVRDDAGVLLGFVKVARDRTDLRGQIERLEIHEATLLESRDRTHLFIKTLGHELRNPLGPLSNAFHIVKKIANDPKLTSAFEIISRQISVLTRLADDLMDVTGLETGKVELKLERVDLRRVLADTVAILAKAADQKRLRLDAVLPKSELWVDIDEGRFERLVLNLVNNAIKYTPEGGRIWVKATQEGADIVFKVEDTGIGISPEVLPRIFELFTRDTQAVNLAPQGLGIGLSMVRGIAEIHGGSIQARSCGVGKGAEFIVRLPASRPLPLATGLDP